MESSPLPTPAPKPQPPRKRRAKPTAPAEVANLLIDTIGTRVVVRGAICSGRVSFPVTRSEADALVAAGLAVVVGALPLS